MWLPRGLGGSTPRSPHGTVTSGGDASTPLVRGPWGRGPDSTDMGLQCPSWAFFIPTLLGDGLQNCLSSVLKLPVPRPPLPHSSSRVLSSPMQVAAPALRDASLAQVVASRLIHAARGRTRPFSGPNDAPRCVPRGSFTRPEVNRHGVTAALGDHVRCSYGHGCVDSRGDPVSGSPGFRPGWDRRVGSTDWALSGPETLASTRIAHVSPRLHLAAL